jgi:hypothetical protein
MTLGQQFSPSLAICCGRAKKREVHQNTHNIPEGGHITILMHKTLPIQRCVRQSMKCTLPDFFSPSPVVCDSFLGTNTRFPHLRWDPEDGHSTNRRCTERCRGLPKALTPDIFSCKKAAAGRPPRLPTNRTGGATSRLGLRFRPNCTLVPAGGALRPQPGTRPPLAPQGTHFPEHNQVWHDRVGRGPNHRLP